MAFKRKRIYAPRSNAFKKRKSYRKRRTSSVRTANYTSLNTRGSRTGFVGRKVTRRAYKKHLWDSTIFKLHYRTINAATAQMNTPNSFLIGTTNLFHMTRFGGVNFWTTTGGLQPHDTGVTTAIFNGDLIVRGGIYTMDIFNESTTDNDVKVSVWFLNSVSNPDYSLAPSTAPIAWDPTASPDFINNIGKPYKKMEASIEAGKSWTIQGRVKLQKIDQVTFAREGYSPIIAVMISNVGHNVITPVRFTRSYNMSFSGDVV